jgi:membrane protein implicated in regulation of membrane protease activity
MDGISITYLWLGAGVLLLLIEAIGLPGTGLMFAGLGALTTGSLLYASFLTEDQQLWQWTLFFIASALWAAILWKPLQQLRVGKKGRKGFSNMIGDTAYVGSNGVTRSGGEVTWSGTIMNARLCESASVDRLDAGSSVTIVAVTGATLTVKPQ